jgi:hypothetical protein
MAEDQVATVGLERHLQECPIDEPGVADNQKSTKLRHDIAQVARHGVGQDYVACVRSGDARESHHSGLAFSHIGIRVVVKEHSCSREPRQPRCSRGQPHPLPVVDRDVDRIRSSNRPPRNSRSTEFDEWAEPPDGRSLTGVRYSHRGEVWCELRHHTACHHRLSVYGRGDRSNQC